jgi:CBS domain-containing protein
MTLTAADVMQTQVITVSPLDPLATVQRLFFEEEIHGAPVVDEEGRVRGMITIMDLIRAATEANESNEVDFIEVFEDIGVGTGWANASEDFQGRLSETVVEDAMTENVVTVAPDTPVPDVARILRENKIHRVLVVNDETLLGIISSFDLIRLLEGVAEQEHPTPV